MSSKSKVTKQKSSSNASSSFESKLQQLPPTAWGWGRTSIPPEVLAWKQFRWDLLLAQVIGAPLFVTYFVFAMPFSLLSLVVFAVVGVVLLFPIFVGNMFVHSRMCSIKNVPFNQELITFKDAALEKKWKGKRMPILKLYEAYFASKIDIEGDLLEALYRRHEYAEFVLTWEHAKFFVFQFIPELLAHTRTQDTDQVRDHYDRGNDFYNAFLGETMIYTSGVFNDMNETLEEAQRNKLELVCNKIHLQKGEKHLDIGCGWGTLLVHASKNYGSDSTGVTLARNQTEYATEQIKKNGVSNNARCLCMDYRDIPEKTNFQKYNKITCLEMAEHVGVKYFQSFLRQVSDMLEDDGIFFLQIAGLRRSWQYEDLMWGLFMGKYVFPGADASCPLFWVVSQLEQAGFEVHSSENIGIHYSATIKRWYDNWKRNRSTIVTKYGERWYRVWLWFLGWAVISPENGMATCHQLVATKNTSAFDRKIFIAERKNYKI